MASKTLAQILTEISNKILTGGRRTTAVNTRSVLTDLADSSLNKKDGGLVVEALTGYSSNLTPTDNNHFANKKYVDDNSGSVPDATETVAGKSELIDDSEVITYSIGSQNTLPASTNKTLGLRGLALLWNRIRLFFNEKIQSTDFSINSDVSPVTTDGIYRNTSGSTLTITPIGGTTINGGTSALSVPSGYIIVLKRDTNNDPLQFIGYVVPPSPVIGGATTQVEDGSGNVILDGTTGYIKQSDGTNIVDLAINAGQVTLINNLSNNKVALGTDDLTADCVFQFPDGGGIGATESYVNGQLTLYQLESEKDVNNGYVGRDSSGGASVVDITVTSATASTLAFISSAKKLITATGALLGTWFQTLTAKATPVDADTIIVNDSAASFEAKKTTLTQFKAFLKTYFDTIYQTLNANLTAISGLTTAANKLTYWTGVGTAALTDLTAFGRSLIDDSNMMAGKVTLAVQEAPDNNGTFVNGTSGGNYTALPNLLHVSPIYTTGRKLSKVALSNVTTLSTNPTKCSFALYEYTQGTAALTVVSQLGEITITTTGIQTLTLGSPIQLVAGKQYMIGYVFDQSIIVARFTGAVNPLVRCNYGTGGGSTGGTTNGGYTIAFTYSTTLPASTYNEGGTNQTIIIWDQIL